LKITAEPRSDQWNAEDFIGGPKTFTIAGVKPGSAEQKYDVELVEGGGRVWRPPVTVLRLLMSAWRTDDSEAWIGRRVTLFRDEKVRFGPDTPGGIRVSHLSHIDKPIKVALTVSRGKRATFTVEPLPDAPAPAVVDWDAELANAGDDLDAIRAIWQRANTNSDHDGMTKAKAAADKAKAQNEAPGAASDA
jgi:hypothetical protein